MTQRAHLFHDVVRLRGAETFLEVLVLGHLAFRNVHEDVHNLKDVIDVGLDSVAPFLDFVLVACNLGRIVNSTRWGLWYAQNRLRSAFRPSSSGR